MTNSSTHGTNLANDARRIEIEAQMARAEAMAETILAIVRGIGYLFAPLGRILRRLAAAAAMRREGDRIFSELSRLSDRDLADIGIARSDIRAIAAGTYARAERQPAAKLSTPLVVLSAAAEKTASTHRDGLHNEMDRAA